MMTPTQAKKNYACREADGETFVVFIFKSIKFWFYSTTCFTKSLFSLAADYNSFSSLEMSIFRP